MAASICAICRETAHPQDGYWHNDSAGILHGRVHEACRESFVNRDLYLQKKCPICKTVVIREGLDLESIKTIKLILIGAAMQMVPIVLRIALDKKVNPAGMANNTLLTGIVSYTAGRFLGAEPAEVGRIAIATTIGGIFTLGALTALSLGMNKI